MPGRGHDLVLNVVDAGGAAVLIERLTFLVPSMISGWSTRITAQGSGDGRLRARVVLPHAGPFAFQPLSLSAPYALSSATIVTALEEGER